MPKLTTPHPLDAPAKNKGGRPRGSGKNAPTFEKSLAWIAQKLLEVENLESIYTVPDEDERERRIEYRAKLLESLRPAAPTLEIFSLLCRSTETRKATDEFWKTYNALKSKEKKDESQAHLLQDDQRKMFRLWDALERERPDIAKSGRESHASRAHRVPSISRVGIRPGDPEPEPVPLVGAVPPGLPADHGQAAVSQ